jgi:hypothetical protein
LVQRPRRAIREVLFAAPIRVIVKRADPLPSPS